MRSRFLIVIGACLTIGCSPSQPAPSSAQQPVQPTQTKSVAPKQEPSTQPLVTQPEPAVPAQPQAPPPDPRVVEFKAQLTVFIKEANSLARYCGDVPDSTRYKQKHDALEDVFLRIPDPPVGYDKVYADARQVRVDLGIGTVNASTMERALKLGSKDLADKCVAANRELADIQKARLAKLQDVLDASNGGNQEVSDTRARWLNESYDTTIYRIKDKDWAELDNKTQKIRWHLNETDRTKDYVEFYFPTRKQNLRIFAKKMEMEKGDKWEWVSKGHWETAPGESDKPIQ